MPEEILSHNWKCMCTLPLLMNEKGNKGEATILSMVPYGAGCKHLGYVLQPHTLDVSPYYISAVFSIVLQNLFIAPQRKF